MPVISLGLNAYAARQAAIYEGIARSFHSLWAPATKKLNISIEWPKELEKTNSTRKIADTVSSSALRSIPPTRQVGEVDEDYDDEQGWFL